MSTTLMPFSYNTTAVKLDTGTVRQFILTTALTTDERADLEDWLALEAV
jgi:hypothetical protein